MQALIIHGFGAHPDGNWFRWLRLELDKLGVQSFAPKFPTPEMQTPANWMKVLENFPDIDENTILIGHSLGGSFVLSILEKHKAKSAFIVAAPLGLLHNREIDPLIADFTNKIFDWNIIKANCGDFHLYYSDNDTYVPIAHGEKLAKNLGVPFVKTQGSGHFMSPSFPRLLEDVKNTLKK